MNFQVTVLKILVSYPDGFAVMEDLRVDEDGRVSTLSFGDYKIPSTMDIPPLRTVLSKWIPGYGGAGGRVARGGAVVDGCAAGTPAGRVRLRPACGAPDHLLAARRTR